jgi:hypothetical protein
VLAQINPQALTALRIAATFFFIVNLLGGCVYFSQPSPISLIGIRMWTTTFPAARRVQVEVVMIPWLVLTTLVLILLISFWLA